jgi:L-ascorbate metabolism protein UlaG (beta-lactamase superfamily)
MVIATLILTLIILGAIVFMNLPQFGKMPSGKRLERIRQSPNYQDGQFQNLTYTPIMVEGMTFSNLIRTFFTKNKVQKKPDILIPSEKHNLLTLSKDSDVWIWLGHSSYFLQINSKSILVDPVLSGHASPAKFAMKSFKGSDAYAPEDLPEIDYLFITHDHWDHLDYETLKKMKSRIRKIITGLGVGAHLERWGFDKDSILEGDWYDTFAIDSGISLTLTPARHFSGRTFRRNKTLWTSFVLKTPTHNLFLGCDGGYDTHFADIGNKFGPFGLALLECGQYNPFWKYIHSMPEDAIRESLDLKARKLMIIHWGKFQLSNHRWNEPITEVTRLAKEHQMNLISPVIGQINLL